MGNKNTILLVDPHKVGVEVVAERYADKGHTIFEPPWYDAIIDMWCIRLEKPIHLRTLN